MEELKHPSNPELVRPCMQLCLGFSSVMFQGLKWIHSQSDQN